MTLHEPRRDSVLTRNEFQEGRLALSIGAHNRNA